MKICTKCGVEKPLSEYYRKSQARGGGHRSACKTCCNRKKHTEDVPFTTLTEQECTKCHTVKPMSEFPVDRYKSSGYSPSCKDCRNKYRRDNRARLSIQEKKYWENNPDKKLAKIRRRQARFYGMSYEEYEAALKTECEICGKKDDLAIDHCHDSGKVRGVLCRPCNRAIGMLGDDFDRVQSAANYLKKKS